MPATPQPVEVTLPASKIAASQDEVTVESELKLIEELLADAENFKSQLKAERAAHEQTSEAAQIAAQSFTELERKYGELQADYTRVNSTLVAANETISQLNQATEQLTSELSAARREVKKRDARLAELEGRSDLDQLAERIRRLRE